MKRRLRNLLAWSILLCVAPALALAQGTTCPDIVEKALAAADQMCQTTGRNQACYGNIELSAQPQPGVQNFVFNQVGDIVDVSSIQSLTLTPMDEASGKWGVALMRLQANLPDTLPGENVTFLLFGDVQMTSAVPEDNPSSLKPMQAFTLRTGANDSPCDEAPESGLLVQTPEGAEEVSFNVNGVDVQMGSTVLFQANADDGMSVSTLEGAALVSADDGVQMIPPGAWARIRLGRELRAEASPELPQSYEGKSRMIRALPLRLLQRRIQAAAPMTKERLELIRTKVQNGELPCGEPPLPRCARLRRFLQNAMNTCAALRPRQRPRFCARLRNFIQKIALNADAENATPATPLNQPGNSTDCILPSLPNAPTPSPKDTPVPCLLPGATPAA